jgi:mono/diheme cytochrome c family protein
MARIALIVSTYEGEQPSNEELRRVIHATGIPATPRREMSNSLIVTIRHALMAAGMSLGMALTMPTLIHAQDSAGNVDSGLALAKAWCSQCHRVEPGTFGIFAADFAEVANLPSTTALSLRVFLQSNHKEMPNFSLKSAEADDIIAYILSFKRK